MLSPKEAYLLFLKYKPDSTAEYIGEWFDGTSYVISNSKQNDFVDDDYLIDMKTGKIRELSFDEYIRTIQSLSEDEIDNSKFHSWLIDDLLSIKN